MRIWVDDVRPMPEGFDVHCDSTYKAIFALLEERMSGKRVQYMSLDHDAGDQTPYGGDFIKVLEFLEWLYRTYGYEICTKFHIHTGNPVGAENMRRIIKRCGWEEFTFDWEEMF